ncbi:unnamed protein product [Macrosiphum euphorbiae]|uniref:Uncharacterized protein n=1 Tax=Macrosiphum euphorbiae TaxID=13131 RepID=A0AAV0WHN0_9HEMI|nr:unnamed protein product [Macrosiphum euphorbiae]
MSGGETSGGESVGGETSGGESVAAKCPAAKRWRRNVRVRHRHITSFLIDYKNLAFNTTAPKIALDDLKSFLTLGGFG